MKSTIIDILQYGMAAYGFLLPNGETTAADFANLIQVTHSMDEPRNKAVYEAINSLSGTFVKDYSGLKYGTYSMPESIPNYRNPRYVSTGRKVERR